MPLNPTLPDLSGRRICILSTDGFEQSELCQPLEQLRAAGASVHVVAPHVGSIRGWDKKDWGQSVAVDHVIPDISASDYDALVLPGGQINPDVLRTNKSAVALVRAFADAGKPIAAICHAPWLLIEASLVEGLTVTSYGSIRTDLRNAGAKVVNEAVVEDRGIITSRSPEDLPQFIAAIAKAVLATADRTTEPA
ncbi:type 1 glutamine amidotransferase domain-containing protein [Blastomonas sp.]|uniref:type 1 glutamine amidotransferase domain-containing protein n=1 Tax=Blastomonas sp. TaxID=1909299 RepID=UPI0035944F64